MKNCSECNYCKNEKSFGMLHEFECDLFGEEHYDKNASEYICDNFVPMYSNLANFRKIDIEKLK